MMIGLFAGTVIYFVITDTDEDPGSINQIASVIPVILWSFLNGSCVISSLTRFVS